jgi:hypothetical protein
MSRKGTDVGPLDRQTPVAFVATMALANSRLQTLGGQPRMNRGRLAHRYAPRFGFYNTLCLTSK